MLTPEECQRYQQNPGTRKILVPEKLWCQQSSGVNKSWYQKSSGATKALVSAKFWCQQNPGTRKVLVPEKFSNLPEAEYLFEKRPESSENRISRRRNA
jgi:hypothetical protein